MTVLKWDTEPTPANREEQVLLPPLLATLRRRRWIGPKSVVLTEFAWNGRRIDLATLNVSGMSSAYELKLGSFHRVLEQAMYNRLSFDRSWIVVRERPQDRNLAQAVENGVGVILLGAQMAVFQSAARQFNNATVRSRLLVALRNGG